MSINPWGAELFTGFYNINDPEAAALIVAERLAEDFVDSSPAFGAPANKAGFASTVRFINSAFHQVYHVDRIIEQDDVVVAIWHADVEHVGQFLHVPPTGKHFQVNGITAYSLKNGLVTRHWEQFDVLAILTNLGVAPPVGG
ncbi:ester cyclase [Pseudomonas cichorii]|nr:ester cyclase [Pseudomonas cichorii]